MKMLARPRAGSEVHRQRRAAANEGWAVMTTLISGFVVWGGIGWLLDLWWGTRLMTPIGLILGMGLGIYAVVARFGRPPAPQASDVQRVPTDRSVGPMRADTRRETQCP